MSWQKDCIAEEETDLSGETIGSGTRQLLVSVRWRQDQRATTNYFIIVLSLCNIFLEVAVCNGHCQSTAGYSFDYKNWLARE